MDRSPYNKAGQLFQYIYIYIYRCAFGKVRTWPWKRGCEGLKKGVENGRTVRKVTKWHPKGGQRVPKGSPKAPKWPFWKWVDKTHWFYYSFEYHTLFSSKKGVVFETVVKSMCFYYTFSTRVIWEPSGSLWAPLGHSWPLLSTLCCPALLLLPPLGPQTSLCASIRPPFFPSTSCPHRFPLGAAVSRSAYNTLGSILNTFFVVVLYFPAILKTTKFDYLTTLF